MVQTEVFKNNISSATQSAPSTTTSIETRKFELMVEKEHMQKMMDATVTVIRGEPLNKLVNLAIVKVISSNHFHLSLSGPIERKVEKLIKIVVAQCKLINQLQKDIKTLKENIQQLLADDEQRKDQSS